MQQSYTITADAQPGEQSVTLLLNGKLGADAVAELEQSIREARELRRRVLIDLSEVTLVDRKAARYLSRAGSDVRVINIPAYLEQWIERGRR